MNNESPLCKNCENMVNGAYCSHCGQSVHTGRINFHYVLHELQHSILHVDKGIFYTIKELIIRPGYAIRDYLSGKRVGHFKPFSFVIILGAIYGFLVHFFNLYPEVHIFSDVTVGTVDKNRVMFEWMYAHYSLIMFVIIPVSALSSYLVFRKSGYNYMEHVIIYSYITGIHIIILMAIYPLYYLTMSSVVYFVTFIVTYFYNVWVLAQLFKTTSWTKVSLKALFSIVLSVFIIFILTVLIVIIVVVLKIYVPQ
ncbi:MAG: DUF3667 domain-containing protein [Dysgonomonas sp.]